MQCLVTFETAYMALKFEKTCRNAGHTVRVVPVPRSLSSSCGFACRFPCESEDEIRKLAQAADIEVAGYHKTEDS